MWPKYLFGSFGGPAHLWFAWFPVKLWYGRWVWLRLIMRRRVIKHQYLHGPDWEFWAHTDASEENPGDI